MTLDDLAAMPGVTITDTDMPDGSTVRLAQFDPEYWTLDDDGALVSNGVRATVVADIVTNDA